MPRRLSASRSRRPVRWPGGRDRRDPDVDLLFVGPSDLSQVLGVTGDFENPKCLAAIEAHCAGVRRAGKPWGVFSRGPEYSARMKDWGCQLFVLGADIHVVHAGVRNLKERYAAFFAGG